MKVWGARRYPVALVLVPGNSCCQIEELIINWREGRGFPQFFRGTAGEIRCRFLEENQEKSNSAEKTQIGEQADRRRVVWLFFALSGEAGEVWSKATRRTPRSSRSELSRLCTSRRSRGRKVRNYSASFLQLRDGLDRYHYWPGWLLLPYRATYTNSFSIPGIRLCKQEQNFIALACNYRAEYRDVFFGFWGYRTVRFTFWLLNRGGCIVLSGFIVMCSFLCCALSHKMMLCTWNVGKVIRI